MYDLALFYRIRPWYIVVKILRSEEVSLVFQPEFHAFGLPDGRRVINCYFSRKKLQKFFVKISVKMPYWSSSLEIVVSHPYVGKLIGLSLVEAGNRFDCVSGFSLLGKHSVSGLKGHLTKVFCSNYKTRRWRHKQILEWCSFAEIKHSDWQTALFRHSKICWWHQLEATNCLSWTKMMSIWLPAFNVLSHLPKLK